MNKHKACFTMEEMGHTAKTLKVEGKTCKFVDNGTTLEGNVKCWLVDTVKAELAKEGYKLLARTFKNKDTDTVVFVKC